MEIRQYQVVLVNLDPTIGSEIKKTRPCIVISPDEINLTLRTIVIAPMTSNKRKYPTRVLIKYKDKISSIALDQIRAIDKRRVIKIEDQLTTKATIEIKSVIRQTYVE